MMFLHNAGMTAIFDVDGTLLDSMDEWCHASERYLLSKGLKTEQIDSVTAFNRGGIQLSCMEILQIYPELGPQDRLIDEITMSMLPMYRDILPPMPHAYEFLKSLSLADVRMCVLTANLRAVIEPGLARLGMLPFFSKVICCCESACTKREPDAFLHCAEQLGVSPEQCVVFEDQPWAAESAKKAGMRVIGICKETELDRWAELVKVCDLVACDYLELL